MSLIGRGAWIHLIGRARTGLRLSRWVAALGLGIAPLMLGPAEAATLAGALPDAATEAMLLAVDCSDDGGGAPASLTLQIRDLAPAATPVVSLQARRNFSAKSTTDAVDGDASASPVIALNEGAGRYDVYVDKNLAGEEAFEVTAQCWTGASGTGATTGTSLRAAQGGAVPSVSPGMQLLLLGLLAGAGAAQLRHRRVGALRAANRPRARRLLLPVLVTVGLGTALSTAARAHSQPGSLGVAASATDYYEVVCFDDGHGAPGSLEIQIRDSSPGAAPFVSVQVHHGSSLRSVSDDLVADIQPSAPIYVNEGAAVHYVLVDKSAAGGKFYDLTYHCWTGPDGTGVHTGSSIVTRQSE